MCTCVSNYVIDLCTSELKNMKGQVTCNVVRNPIAQPHVRWGWGLRVGNNPPTLLQPFPNPQLGLEIRPGLDPPTRICPLQSGLEELGGVGKLAKVGSGEGEFTVQVGKGSRGEYLLVTIEGLLSC